MSAVGWLALAGWVACGALAVAALSLRCRLELGARAEHELRGSLGVIALAVERLRRSRAGPELAEVLDAQLARSRAGLGDLRAALEGGRRGRPRGSQRGGVAIEQLARLTAAGFAPLAARAGRRLRIDWGAGQAAVPGDRGRLAQALGNLLSNALEHGAGDVEVRSTRVGGAIRVEVADGGPAAAAPRRATSTDRQERPSQAAAGGRRRLDGRGRGLRIASRAVEEAGGRLELSREPGGTTAAFELPLEDA